MMMADPDGDLGHRTQDPINVAQLCGQDCIAWRKTLARVDSRADADDDLRWRANVAAGIAEACSQDSVPLWKSEG